MFETITTDFCCGFRFLRAAGFLTIRFGAGFAAEEADCAATADPITTVPPDDVTPPTGARVEIDTWGGAHVPAASSLMTMRLRRGDPDDAPHAPALLDMIGAGSDALLTTHVDDVIGATSEARKARFGCVIERENGCEFEP